MSQSLNAGVSILDITPPPGVWMTGFAHRDGPAEGVLDPLFARTLVLEHKGVQLAILSLDLIQIEHSLLEEIRSEIETRTGIAGDRILINATHNHSGPAVCRFHHAMGPFEKQRARDLGPILARAVEAALHSLEEADLSFAEGTAKIGVNRRQPGPGGTVQMGAAPNRPYDPAVPVLRVDSRANGGLRALLFAHACHPVILGAANRLFSADFPGAACRTISRSLGEHVVPFFLQGCGGNINPPPDERSRDAVGKTGQTLADEVRRVAARAAPVKVSRLAAISEYLSLPLIPPETPEQYEREAIRFRDEAGHGDKPARARIARGRAEWAGQMARLTREKRAPRHRPMVLQALQIGELAIVGIQAEPFVETGMAIRRLSPFTHTITLGYTNGCLGYLPIAEAYPEGGYEVIDSARFYDTLMFAPEAEAMVVKKSTELLSRLHAGDAGTA